jgi:EmrB/QacA subfamily drug resistance transporter
VILGGFMTSLDAFIVNVAVPTIRRDLDTSFAAIELVVAGYVLSYAVLLVASGRLGDRWSPRTAFMLGLAVFTVSSLACGLAPDVGSLVAARVVQGVGAALLYPQVFAVIQLCFAGPARSRALGLLSGANGLGSILGQVGGGFLVRLDVFGSSWRSLFLVNVPIGVAGLVAAARLLPRTRRREHADEGLDPAGIVLLAAAMVLLMVPLVEGQERDWPGWALACLVASPPAFALFALHERRLARSGRAPLVDVELLRRRRFALGTAAAFLTFAQAAGLFFVLAITLQTGLGFSPFRAGVVFVPLGTTYVVTTILASRSIDRLGRRLLLLGPALALAGTAGTAAVAYAERADFDVWTVVPLLALMTAGNGFATAPLLGTVLAGVRERHTGLAAGVVATSMRVGQALGVVVVGLVFTAALGAGAALDEASYVRAFALAAGANVLLIALAAGCIAGLGPARAEPQPLTAAGAP